MSDVYCHKCGQRLVLIASGTFSRNQGFFTEKHGVKKKVWDETVDNSILNTVIVRFYACILCKELFAVYGYSSQIFESLGILSDSFVSSYLANKLKDD